MDRSETLSATVQVAYALPDVQHVEAVSFEAGLTAGQAVERSGLLKRVPEIAARELVLGLFGRVIDADHVLEPGDRVEICRPLERDPRDLRRELLKHGRVMGAAGRDDDDEGAAAGR